MDFTSIITCIRLESQTSVEPIIMGYECEIRALSFEASNEFR